MPESPCFDIDGEKLEYVGDATEGLCGEKMGDIDEKKAPVACAIEASRSPSSEDLLVISINASVAVFVVDTMTASTALSLPTFATAISCRVRGDRIEVAACLASGCVALFVFDLFTSGYKPNKKEYRIVHEEFEHATACSFLHQGDTPTAGRRKIDERCCDLCVCTDAGEVVFYYFDEDEDLNEPDVSNIKWEKKDNRKWERATFSRSNPPCAWRIFDESITAIHVHDGKSTTGGEGSEGSEVEITEGDVDHRDGEAGPKLHLMAIANKKGAVLVFDMKDLSLLYILESFFGAILAVSISWDATLIATGGEDDTVVLWNAEDGHLLAAGEKHRARVRGLAFDRHSGGHGVKLVSVGEDRRVVWYSFDWDKKRRDRTISFPTSVLSSTSAGGGGGTADRGRQGQKGDRNSVRHIVAGRPAESPDLPSICTSMAHPDPLLSVHCLPSCVVTVSWDRRAAVWKRP
uniref:Uncharacterized protein n=1 Tax=Palpitomonas bilix TaxID=652834 RepID=A0A7S3DCY6_9EUKA|mmetsp:Transcript_31624/g.82533  ORF Transcript_31624/g.82533 Transcript_31624/m.82533 type:complete len:462 (+) Transcript_31624:210-1595(+)